MLGSGGYAPRPERVEEVAAAVGLLVLGELLGEQRHDEVLDLVEFARVLMTYVKHLPREHQCAECKIMFFSKDGFELQFLDSIPIRQSMIKNEKYLPFRYL